MLRCAKDGALRAELIESCKRFCREAERRCPRTGPGRKPEIPAWVLAVMIMVAVLARRKSKLAQWRYWRRRGEDFAAWSEGSRLPGCSTFYDRYPSVYVVYATALRLQAEEAIRRGWAEVECVAVDKSLIAGRGRRWSARGRRRRHVPRGVDAQATWGFAQHRGWVQGYAYEVVVSAPSCGVVWPLSASVDTASRSEHRSFAEKIPQLPPGVRYVLADAGYDSNALGEAVEENRRTPRRRFLCPQIRRPNVGRPRRVDWKRSRARLRSSRARRRRSAWLRSARGRRLYRRRKTRIEPFHARFKQLFELQDRVWLWGLAANQTLLAAALFAYQSLLACNHRRGRRNARVKWILDHF